MKKLFVGFMIFALISFSLSQKLTNYKIRSSFGEIWLEFLITHSCNDISMNQKQ